jgi:dihydrodipicolinate synthase/N-acetylneuraminate lyase
VNDSLRGIFAVVQTPLDQRGELDVDSLKREIAFCITAGAHGVVFPVLGSEFQFLSDRERQHLVEVVVGAAGGQIPVVAGVAGSSTPVAVEHAAHAKRVGADAVIALPPYIAGASRDEILDYYRAISDASGLPIFIQNSLPGLDPAFLMRLIREVEHVHYIKEEANPSAHNISAVVNTLGSECRGVFGGAWGRWMMSEMRRGASGFMPSVEIVDIHVQIWNAFQAGDEAGARQIYNRLLPLINLTFLLGLRLCKEILVRRGVIETARMRTPGTFELDEEDYRELDTILADLRPLFKA